MEEIFGGLVKFEKKIDLDSFVDGMTKNDAIKLIEMALTFGLKNGIYSLEDSFVIYKSISKIKEKYEVDNILNGDNNGSSNN